MNDTPFWFAFFVIFLAAFNLGWVIICRRRARPGDAETAERVSVGGVIRRAAGVLHGVLTVALSLGAAICA